MVMAIAFLFDWISFVITSFRLVKSKINKQHPCS